MSLFDSSFFFGGGGGWLQATCRTRTREEQRVVFPLKPMTICMQVTKWFQPWFHFVARVPRISRQSLNQTQRQPPHIRSRDPLRRARWQSTCGSCARPYRCSTTARAGRAPGTNPFYNEVMGSVKKTCLVMIIRAMCDLAS